MKIKSIKTAKKITGKKVLLRVDFNVPLSTGISGKKEVIEDEFKIIKTLPTIEYLLKHKCKIVIATHLGRPFKDKKVRDLLINHKTGEAEVLADFSVKPIAKRLGELLDKKVKFVNDVINLKAGSLVGQMERGDIVCLQNLRFEKGELDNDLNFAKELAKFGDIYVNDAFSVCHRAQASVSAIKNFLPSYAGLLLEQEIEYLNKAIKPKKPLILVIGGAKIETKIPLIKKFQKKSHRILIGGALANNFFAAHKLEVGKSLVDKNSIKFAKKFKDKNIILPIDVIVSTKKKGGKLKLKKPDEVSKNELILDIGPETIRLFAGFIKKANTIIWNGPLGMFEQEEFKNGTVFIARVIASRSTGKAYGVVGGGETIEALKLTKMFEYVDWVSTGGGAMLSYLGGEKMPGLKGIVGK